MKKLWILTEERPKKKVVGRVVDIAAKLLGISYIYPGGLRIIPRIENGRFVFAYEVLGFNSKSFDSIIIKTVSGNSSFVDYLVYFQEELPRPDQAPLVAIEETKTTDAESRNTAVFQRCSKFVYIDAFYPGIGKRMLYSVPVDKSHATDTNVFGSRMLATHGVKMLDIKGNDVAGQPFASIDELIRAKNSMRQPPKGNVPITITLKDNDIFVSGRLVKSDSLSHDPNIGALSMISANLRKLGWKGGITITQHGLLQRHVKTGKFVQMANMLGIELDGLKVPQTEPADDYWRYDTSGEKLGTIFIHLAAQAFTDGYSIFENHAGCEKGYFMTSDGTEIAIEKYVDREKYKAGDKDARMSIPDLVLLDLQNMEVINTEGKKIENMDAGVEQLKKYGPFEHEYIQKYYPDYKIVRTLVLYGGFGKDNKGLAVEVGFLLNAEGRLILGISAPKLFIEAIRNLLDYWKNAG